MSTDCPLTLTCEAKFSQTHQASGIRATWLLNDKKINEEGLKSILYDGSATYYLLLPCDISNFGNLTCLVSIEEEQNISISAMKSINLEFPVTPKITETRGARVNGSQNASLHCSAQGFPPPDITWTRLGDLDGVIEEQASKISLRHHTKSTSTSSQLELSSAQRSDNGTYVCHASSASGKDTKNVALFVQTKPEVSIDYALGVGNGTLYLNWTLNDGNLPVLRYHIKYMKENTTEWRFTQRPNVSMTSHIISGLEPDVAYRIQMEAENSMGRSHPSQYSEAVRTLSGEVDYIPVADVKGSTSNSFTIGWTAPPEDIRHLIGHYLVSYKDAKQELETPVRVAASEGSPVHLFTDLKPATLYVFKVRACHRFLARCGDFSEPVNGTTIDGAPSMPQNVALRCERDQNNNNFYVDASWDPPAQPNGQLVHFTVTLVGVAHFLNERRQEQRDDYGPMTQNVVGTKFTARFDPVPPNTNFTVHVKAETRTMSGPFAQARCRMPPSMPDKENLAGITVTRYRKANAPDQWGLRVNVPKVSQRKGPVCCYSVVVVKMLDGKTISTLPEPHSLPLLTYEEVHKQGAGAYIAELFDADRVPPEGVSLGDESRIDKTNPPCRSCSGIFWTDETGDEVSGDKLVRRSSSSSSTAEPSSPMIRLDSLSVDGALSPRSNYTMFVQVPLRLIRFLLTRLSFDPCSSPFPLGIFSWRKWTGG